MNREILSNVDYKSQDVQGMRRNFKINPVLPVTYTKWTEVKNQKPLNQINHYCSNRKTQVKNFQEIIEDDEQNNYINQFYQSSKQKKLAGSRFTDKFFNAQPDAQQKARNKPSSPEKYNSLQKSLSLSSQMLKSRLNNSLQKKQMQKQDEIDNQKDKIIQLHKSLKKVIEHILKASNEEKFERKEEILRIKQGLSIEKLVEQKKQNIEQTEQFFESLRLLISKKTDYYQTNIIVKEQQQETQTKMQDGSQLLTLSQVSQSFQSGSGFGTDTNNTRLSALMQLRGDKELEKKLSKYFDIQKLKQLWNIWDTQLVENVIRRMFVRDILAESERMVTKDANALYNHRDATQNSLQKPQGNHIFAIAKSTIRKTENEESHMIIDTPVKPQKVNVEQDEQKTPEPILKERPYTPQKSSAVKSLHRNKSQDFQQMNSNKKLNSNSKMNTSQASQKSTNITVFNSQQKKVEFNDVSMNTACKNLLASNSVTSPHKCIQSHMQFSRAFQSATAKKISKGSFIFN